MKGFPVALAARRVVLGVFLAAALAPSVPAQGLPAGWLQSPEGQQGAGDIARSISKEQAVGGYTDMAPLASALLREAEVAPSAERAEELGRLAAQASPDDPRPRAFLLQLSLRRLSLGTAVREGASLVASLANDPWVLGTFLKRAAAVLCAGAWAAALALILLGTARNGGSLLHDYCDTFPTGFRRYSPRAFALLTLSILWVAGVGPAVLLLLFALFLCPYLNRKGRIAVGICLLIGCLFPVSLGWVAVDASPWGQRAWELYRVSKGDGGADLAGDLARSFGGEDARVLFARARVARREGDFPWAEELLERALPRAAADTALVRLELGNLYFGQGNTDRAVAEYDLAAKARPKDPLPWFNRHLAFLTGLELAAADENLERAKSLDASAVERFQSEGLDGSEGLLPVNAPLPKKWVLEPLLQPAEEAAGWVLALQGALFVPLLVLRPVYFGMFALLVAFLTLKVQPGRRTHRCPSCGFLVCPRCTRRVRGTDLCPACWNAQRAEELDASEKDQQAERVSRWQVRSSRLVRLGRALLPGWSEYLQAAPGFGALLGSLWALAVGWIVVGLLYPAPVLPWGTPRFPWGGAVLLGLTYAIGFRRALSVPVSRGRG